MVGCLLGGNVGLVDSGTSVWLQDGSADGSQVGGDVGWSVGVIVLGALEVVHTALGRYVGECVTGVILGEYVGCFVNGVADGLYVGTLDTITMLGA